MLDRLDHLLRIPRYPDPLDLRSARNVSIFAALVIIVAIVGSSIAIIAAYEPGVQRLILSICIFLVLAGLLSLWMVQTFRLEYAGVPLLVAAFLSSTSFLFQYRLTGVPPTNIRYEYGLLWLSIIGAAALANGRVIASIGGAALVVYYFAIRDIKTFDPALTWGTFGELSAVTVVLTCAAWLINSNLQQVTAYLASRAELRRLQVIESAQLALTQLVARQDLEALLSQIVRSLGHQFEQISQVQIYLADDEHGGFVLRASTGGPEKATMPLRAHISMDDSAVISQVAQQGEAVLVSDTRQEQLAADEMLWADSRSHLLLPLVSPDRVIGVLGLFSRVPAAFIEQDVQPFQSLANELAMIIEQTRLVGALRETAQENAQLLEIEQRDHAKTERLNKNLTRQTWREFLNVASMPLQRTVDVASGRQIVFAEKTPTLQKAAQLGQVVVEARNSKVRVAMPIKVHEVTVGVIEFELANTQATLPPATEEALNILGGRIGMIAENARGLETLRQVAGHQEQLNRISSSLHGITEVEALLSTALSELGMAIGAEQGTVRLTPVVEENGHGLDLAKKLVEG